MTILRLIRRVRQFERRDKNKQKMFSLRRDILYVTLCSELMCSFIVVHERSITKCDLINNIIKTLLPRSIDLFLFFYEFMGIVPMSVLCSHIIS